MKRILLTLIAATAAVLATLAPTPASASILGGGGGPYNAPPALWVQVVNTVDTVPVSAYATNKRQFNDRTAIVISSVTPGVCTIPANSFSVGTYQDTPKVPITIVGKGTCTIRASQAASSYYVAGQTDRSYVIR